MLNDNYTVLLSGRHRPLVDDVDIEPWIGAYQAILCRQAWSGKIQ